jgi:enoyl-[acyl-carrier-protein] reductase (NADH)
VVALAGCGSGGSSSSASKGEATQTPTGTKSFPKDKESKKYVAFGEEASSAEREAASAVLTENLEARQTANFAGQCGSLGKAGLESVLGPVKEMGKAKAECPSSLKTLAEPLSNSKELRANTLSGPIAALRVKGAKGYALYHGNDGNDYAMPMEKEGGKWLVGSILTTELS